MVHRLYVRLKEKKEEKIWANKGPPEIPEKNIFLRTMNFLETSGSGTQQIVQGTGIRRVAPTAMQY